MKNSANSIDKKQIILKIITTIVLLGVTIYVGVVMILLIAFSNNFNNIFTYLIIADLIVLALTIIWKPTSKLILISLVVGGLCICGSGAMAGYKAYQESLVINVTSNIINNESKIVKLESETKLTVDLQTIDGAYTSEKQLAYTE